MWVMQHQRQNLDHFPVAAGVLGQVTLQAAERLGKINERRAVAQGAGLALDHRQIVPPVIDRASRQVMRSLNDAGMLTQDLTLGHQHDPLGVNPQADRPVREGGRHAVAVALEVYQTGRRDPLGLLDKAIEGPPQCHQAGDLAGMHIGDAARKAAMHDLAPLRDAPLFEPGVQGIEIGEAGQWLPQPSPCILNVLLHLALLPPRSRVAELRLEQVVAGHRGEPGVDLPGLARADPVDRGLHVVEDTASGHAAKDTERLSHGVEQHFVGLQQIGPNNERPAVRQLGMGHLQLGALAAQNGPVLTPVELEGLARSEHQGHEGAAPAGLLLSLPPSFPGPHSTEAAASSHTASAPKRPSTWLRGNEISQ